MKPFFQRFPPLLSPLVCVACTTTGIAAWAQDADGQHLWEIGSVALGVSQQAYPGSDQQVGRALALPFFVYRGKVLRAERGFLGVRAMQNPTFELDVGVSGAFGSNSNSIDARNGMPNLGTLIELGPRIKWNLGSAPGEGKWRADLPLRAVFDISEGGAHRGFSFEPELVYERRAKGGWRYNTSLGALIADHHLAATFYQVSPQQATLARPAYSAQSGLVSFRLASSFTRSLTPDWRLFGFARLDTVAGSANKNSPLVRQNSGVTVGMGVAYTWTRSSELASNNF